MKQVNYNKSENVTANICFNLEGALYDLDDTPLDFRSVLLVLSSVQFDLKVAYVLHWNYEKMTR